jgi:pyruvate kinase
MIKRTKIVCTIGPESSESPEMIRALIESGMNVARINMAHGTHDEHRAVIERVRAVARALWGCPWPSWPTPRARRSAPASSRSEKIFLRQGQKLTLVEEPVLGDETQISISYKGLSQYIRPGMRILLANGEIELGVLEVHPGRIVCEVKNSRELGERKRVSMPEVDAARHRPDRRRRYSALPRAVGVDYIAASFVQTGLDIDHIRRLLGPTDIEIIAKIETREAARNIDDIIAASDGVMVARGDLGVELPPEEVPLLQKEIVKEVQSRGQARHHRHTDAQVYDGEPHADPRRGR